MVREKTIRKVTREIADITYNIELATDKDPSRNRFMFEGDKYCWIIRTPEPVEKPLSPPVPSTRESVLNLVQDMAAIKAKLGVKDAAEAMTP